jgi:hypothetical protein
MTDMFSLAERLSAELFTIENNRGKSMRRTYADAGDKLLLAQASGVDESAFGSISRKLFPADYAAELKAANDAVTAQTVHFERHTLPFDHSAGGRARPRRAILASRITDGTFLSENRALCDQVRHAGERFAVALPHLMASIQADPRYMRAFDAGKYPTPDDVRAAYTFQYAQETLEPLPSGASFPVSNQALQAAQRAFEERLASKYRFGMQRASLDLAGYLATMAERVGEWARYQAMSERDREAEFGSRAKAPGWKSTLTTNVTDAVAKLREFALPDTREGAQLLVLLDEIDETLTPQALDTESIRSSVRYAEHVAATAAQLQGAIADLGFFD